MRLLSEKSKQRLQPLLIAVNIILIAALILLFIVYDRSYQKKIYQQNVDDIANINQAAANISSFFFTGKNMMLKGAALYIRDNDCTLEETLQYLYTTTAADDTTNYEIIGPDGCGFLVSKDADGDFIPVDYSRGYGDHFEAILRAQPTEIDEQAVRFLPEFTDAGTGQRSFAFYSYLNLSDQNGQTVPYTLLTVAKTADFADQLNLHSAYENLATVLIDQSGNYIIGNSAFKSTNLYLYLAAYNELSLDQHTQLAAEVIQNGKGVLAFKNSKGQPTVFLYAKVIDRDWICVTSVPVESFHDRSFDISYTAIVIAALMFLMVIDFLFMRGMNRTLKVSVEKEKIASAAKTDFLSRMSHDIRTPMNAIIGYLGIARDAGNSMDKIWHCLDNCEIAAKQLLQLINDILDMSSIERGKLKLSAEEFELKQTIIDVTTIFYQSAHAKHVHFKSVLDGVTEEWTIGDPLRLNQILMNLISNAVKFTPADGSVRLTVQQEAQQEAPDRTEFCFSVSDTGIGMSEEYMSRLFQPFEQESSTTAKRYGGSGLGLSIAHNLVEMMGGTMTVQSVQGEGTTFTVRLPFGKAREHTAVVQKIRSTRVLIVDDDQAEAACFKASLKELGAKADLVQSAAEAEKRIRSRMDTEYSFDVCVLNADRAGAHLMQLAEEFGDMFGDRCPAIAVLAYDVTEYEDEAEAAGVRVVMAKPMFLSTWHTLLVKSLGIAAADTEALPAQKEPDLSGLRVLLAEDNPMNMEIAVTVLQKVGVRVDSAENGKQALDRFTDAPAGTYDLILMDVQMPVMDGYEATRAIRQSGKPDAGQIPVIAMTANAFTEDVAEAKANGMNAHISKPVSRGKLFEILNEFSKH